LELTLGAVLAAPSPEGVELEPIPLAVPRLRRSRCSTVSSVLGGAAFTLVLSLPEPAGKLERCEESTGEAERVVGACMAVEFVALEFVVTEAVDVHPRREVGRQGPAVPDGGCKGEIRMSLSPRLDPRVSPSPHIDKRESLLPGRNECESPSPCTLTERSVSELPGTPRFAIVNFPNRQLPSGSSGQAITPIIVYHIVVLS
jgi:hypothetical protein